MPYSSGPCHPNFGGLTFINSRSPQKKEIDPKIEKNLFKKPENPQICPNFEEEMKKIDEDLKKWEMGGAKVGGYSISYEKYCQYEDWKKTQIKK